MEIISDFFRDNLAEVSKEELLGALEDALQSANYWRDACLLGCLSIRSRSDMDARSQKRRH